MAYKSNDLSVLAYANGFTLWHYTSIDTTAEIDSSGYFNEAADMVRVGDMILANTDTDGTPKAGIHLISSVAAGVVDVNDLTQVGVTDTD
ncbi:MAG: hypothetical protein OQK35_05640 [Alphaproteobacteria bacterium]|nr:hypothetical protein [Rhodospirillales bacterium]MCW9045797.1 hypothetical protein [Alphaproteobacteria bacterium]